MIKEEPEGKQLKKTSPNKPSDKHTQPTTKIPINIDDEIEMLINQGMSLKKDGLTEQKETKTTKDDSDAINQDNPVISTEDAVRESEKLEDVASEPKNPQDANGNARGRKPGAKKDKAEAKEQNQAKAKQSKVKKSAPTDAEEENGQKDGKVVEKNPGQKPKPGKKGNAKGNKDSKSSDKNEHPTDSEHENKTLDKNQEYDENEEEQKGGNKNKSKVQDKKGQKNQANKPKESAPEVETKKFSDDECKLKILEYFKSTNKPYSNQNIFDNLHKFASKAKITEILAILGKEEHLSYKDYSKLIVYHYNQSKLPEISKEKLAELNKEFDAKKTECEEQEKIAKELRQSLALLRNTKSIEGLTKQVEQLTQLKESQEKDIENYKVKNYAPISQEEINILQKKKDMYLDDLKKKKALGKEAASILSEAMEMKQKEFYKQIGIEPF